MKKEWKEKMDEAMNNPKFWKIIAEEAINHEAFKSLVNLPLKKRIDVFKDMFAQMPESEVRILFEKVFNNIQE